jgi:hypothetical protein
MNLEYLANLAEVFGMIMVVISLIYLNIQARQNTIMLRSAATQGATDQVADSYTLLISDEGMTDIFMRGLPEPESLSPVENGRLWSWWMRAMFIMQNWYFQTRDGLMHQSALNSLGKLMTDMGQTKGLQQFWAARKYAFDPEFVKFMENEVFNQQANENYRALSSR